MNNNKIGLVALHSTSFPVLGESHGINVIGGYLKSKNQILEIKYFDMQLDTEFDLIEYILEETPALLGISVKQYTYEQFKQLYKSIELKIPLIIRPLIIVGNAIPSFNGRDFITKHSGVIACWGEGEVAFQGLLEYINGYRTLDSVCNIIYYKNGAIVENKRKYLNTDEISMPYRGNTVRFTEKQTEVYIEGSRGCAYGACSICACNMFLGSKNKDSKWRPRPIKNIINDLIELQYLGVKNVTFSDEDFYGKGIKGVLRIKKLCEEIINNKIEVSFRINVCVKSIYDKNDDEVERRLKQEVVSLLKKAGLSKIYLGLESGVSSQLKRYRKGFLLDEFDRALNIVRENQVECEFGIILIDPLMNIYELKESLIYIRKNDFIQEIGSIYKELRVQVCTSYLKQIRDIEQAQNISLLGEFNYNNQCYEIKRYLDDMVGHFVKIASPWVNLVYKVYYLLRIYTRYSENNDIGKIYFTIIKEIRELEYFFLVDLCNNIISNGIENKYTLNIILNYEEQRKEILKKLLNENISFTIPCDLEQVVSQYFIKSDRLFKENLLREQEYFEECENYIV